MANLEQRINTLKQKLNLDKLRQEIETIEKESAKPGFWQDHEKASAKMKKMAEMQKEIEAVEALEELLAEGKEEELERKLDKLETKTFLSGEKIKESFTIFTGMGRTNSIIIKVFQHMLEL